MKLYRRFSSEPLVEIRLDYGSSRTVANRPYLWFHEQDDGRMRKRMRAIPLSVEEADGFVEQFLPYLIEASGQPDAVERIHEFFVGCGFDTRRAKGRGRRIVPPDGNSPTRIGRRVRGLLKKFRLWGRHGKVV